MRVYIGSVAEWSKALVLGTSVFGGVGSNPTAVNIFFIFYFCSIYAFGNEFTRDFVLSQLLEA